MATAQYQNNNQPRRPSVSQSLTAPSTRSHISQPQQPSGTLADLTACIRSTNGEIPPPLVGASITVLGTSIYVFGGRLVPTRMMISDMYRLNLSSLEWQKIWPPPPDPSLRSSHGTATTSDSKGKSRARDPDLNPELPPSHSRSPSLNPSPDHQSQSASIPPDPNLHESKSDHPPGPHPRYFHSAEAWGHKLVIFGGMGYSNPANSTDPATRPTSPPQQSESDSGLCVLDDLVIFDSITRTWSFPTTSPAPDIAMPSPRYAHLSCLTSETGYEPPTALDDHDESHTYVETVSLTNTPIKILQPHKRRKRNLLTLLGGQDILNRYIGEINVLDLDSMQWIEGRRWERHCGTYRSVACTAQLTVRQGDRPDGSDNPEHDEDFLRRFSWSEKPSVERPEPVYLYSNFNFNDVRRDLELISYPTTPPPLPATPSSTGHYTTIHPLSHTMSGVLPSGLRFPTGAIIGNHMIISGTLLNQDKTRDHIDCFAIWALDLSQANHKHVPIKVPHGQRPDVSTYNNTQFGAGKVIWQRIDPGRIMMSGSWNRAVGWGNCLVILGNRDRDIVDDYHHRQINFVDLAFIDLEPFAIYQPPFSNQSYVPQGFSRETSLKSARLGLSLLSNIHLSDFEIICVDGTVIPLNKKMLEDRWPWFKEQLDQFKLKATKVNVAYQKQMQQYCESKWLETKLKKTSAHLSSASTTNGSNHHSSPSSSQTPPSSSTTPTETSDNETSKTRTRSADTIMSNMTAHLSLTGLPKLPEIRLPEAHQVTARTLYLPHPSVVVQAVLEYLFTTDLVTPLHQTPAILCSLLILATSYKLEHLRMLTVHGLHRYLSPSTSRSLAQFGGTGNVAALIYEAATLSGCMALQIRSLKAIIAAQAKQQSAAGSTTGGHRSSGGGAGGGSTISMAHSTTTTTTSTTTSTNTRSTTSTTTSTNTRSTAGSAATSTASLLNHPANFAHLSSNLPGSNRHYSPPSLISKGRSGWSHR